jgi:hypothetical protein
MVTNNCENMPTYNDKYLNIIILVYSRNIFIAVKNAGNHRLKSKTSPTDDF